MALVLVTGGSGFIGSHCILRLLADGHQVRTTVRSLAREGDVRAMLKDEGWDAAVAGCEYVLHVASPLPVGVPKDEKEVIGPARAGTLRVLRAARKAGVKRVVLTSSFAAVGYGHGPMDRPFHEGDWTDPAAPRLSAYTKSKTLAEMDAWEFIGGEGKGLELATVNPVVVLGPVLAPDYSASIELIKSLLTGSLPGCPRLWFGTVDVRDVADLHVRAMTHPRAKGERFLCVSGDFLSVRDMALLLKERLGGEARRVPTRVLPDWLVRLASVVNPKGRAYLTELGKRKNATAAKAQNLLGWAPRAPAETFADTAESLKRFGLIRS
jgi:nucleoside-diphosphate-sugar epimerase